MDHRAGREEQASIVEVWPQQPGKNVEIDLLAVGRAHAFGFAVGGNMKVAAFRIAKFGDRLFEIMSRSDVAMDGMLSVEPQYPG